MRKMGERERERECVCVCVCIVCIAIMQSSREYAKRGMSDKDKYHMLSLTCGI